MKRCHICKTFHPMSFFYRNNLTKDGYANRCKNCERIVKREQRLKNKGTFTEKDSRYYLNNKEKIREKRKKWYLENYQKVSAHEKVKRAISMGELVRKNCEICGSIESVAHHDDYSKPLDVRWLCQMHHMRFHHGH